MVVPGSVATRVLIAFVLLTAAGWSVVASDNTSSTYTPVSPPRALLTALQINLKLAREWLDGNDYVSAGQTAQGLIVLAQLYSYQSGQPHWQQRTKALAEASGRLLAATKKNDDAACANSARACAELLDELAKNPPSGPKVIAPKFASFGSTKTWMLLLDGCYVDAKSAKKAAELEDLAYTLAEALTVASHLRNEPKWRTMAVEAQAAALTTAQKAAANDLEGARRELKNVYHRCEACHQGYKK